MEDPIDRYRDFLTKCGEVSRHRDLLRPTLQYFGIPAKGLDNAFVDELRCGPIDTVLVRIDVVATHQSFKHAHGSTSAKEDDEETNGRRRKVRVSLGDLVENGWTPHNQCEAEAR